MSGDLVRFVAERQFVGDDRVATLRSQAAERFARLGFPSQRDEEWHYGALPNALRDRWLDLPNFPKPMTHSAAVLERLAALPGPRIVFSDGRFAPELSQLDLIPGLTVIDLGRALDDRGDFTRKLLEAGLDRATHGVSLSNLALFQDGALIHSAQDTLAAEPVYLVHLASGPSPVHLRHLVVADARSSLAVVEVYLGAAGTLLNALSDIHVGEGASVSWSKLEDEAATSAHFAEAQVQVAKAGSFSSCVVQLGAAFGRSELRVELGEGAECLATGLYVADGERYSDNVTVIDHPSHHARSRQLYKGIVRDSATAIFYGKVLVRPGTRRNEAHQVNKNLLLSEGAVAHTRPQLQIDSEDVQCSHGATVGRLDDEQLFYLRSRGVGEREAYAMLLRAFAAEVLDVGAHPRVRAMFEEAIERRLDVGSQTGIGATP